MHGNSRVISYGSFNLRSRGPPHNEMGGSPIKLKNKLLTPSVRATAFLAARWVSLLSSVCASWYPKSVTEPGECNILGECVVSYGAPRHDVRGRRGGHCARPNPPTLNANITSTPSYITHLAPIYHLSKILMEKINPGASI